MDLDKLGGNGGGLEQRRADAREALARIIHAIKSHTGTGQVVRLVRFLAGVYNSSEYPFELAELRGLDSRLADACLTYLAYDVLGEKEVHHYIPGGGKQLNKWIEEYGLRPVEPTLDRFARVKQQQDEQGVFVNAKLVTYGNAPGYRDISLRFNLVEPLGGQAPLRVDMHIPASDSETIFRHIIDVNRTAWGGRSGRPIDAKDNERRPGWLEKLV